MDEAGNESFLAREDVMALEKKDTPVPLERAGMPLLDHAAATTLTTFIPDLPTNTIQPRLIAPAAAGCERLLHRTEVIA